MMKRTRPGRCRAWLSVARSCDQERSASPIVKVPSAAWRSRTMTKIGMAKTANSEPMSRKLVAVMSPLASVVSPSSSADTMLPT